MLALVALLGVACSSTINTTTLEQEVAAQVAVQREVAASEVSVDCPDSIEVSAGAVTRCSATIAGTSADIDLTQSDGDGNVEWVIVEPEAAPTP